MLSLLSPHTKHKNALAWVRLGKTLERRGDIEGAIAHYQKGMQIAFASNKPLASN